MAQESTLGFIVDNGLVMWNLYRKWMGVKGVLLVLNFGLDSRR